MVTDNLRQANVLVMKVIPVQHYKIIAEASGGDCFIDP
jgi:hypothetical protein